MLFQIKGTTKQKKLNVQTNIKMKTEKELQL